MQSVVSGSTLSVFLLCSLCRTRRGESGAVISEILVANYSERASRQKGNNCSTFRFLLSSFSRSLAVLLCFSRSISWCKLRLTPGFAGDRTRCPQRLDKRRRNQPMHTCLDPGTSSSQELHNLWAEVSCQQIQASRLQIRIHHLLVFAWLVGIHVEKKLTEAGVKSRSRGGRFGSLGLWRPTRVSCIRVWKNRTRIQESVLTPVSFPDVCTPKPESVSSTAATRKLVAAVEDTDFSLL